MKNSTISANVQSKLAFDKNFVIRFLYANRPFHTLGFGLFATSHLLSLIGLETSLFVLIAFIRIAAYISILYALFKEYLGN